MKIALAKRLKAARKTKRMTIAEILGGDKKQLSTPKLSEEEEFTPMGDDDICDDDIREDDIKVNPWIVPEITENPNEP
jgi:hypothetical protein